MQISILLALLLVAPLVLHARDLTLPNHKLTPGVATALGVKDVCGRKWGKDVRHVTAAMKRQVFERYGLIGNDDKACKPDEHGRHCEIDHRLPRELGGADVILNLWAEPFGTKPWNAALKDRLENFIHRKVCSGDMTLEEGQAIFLGDWTKGYLEYIGKP